MSKPSSLPTLSRRTVLRGAGGAALALPWLEIMQPRRARAADAAPKRFVAWCTADGQNMANWMPAVLPPTEQEFKLGPILAPLERHRKDLVIVQGLRGKGIGGHSWACGQLCARPVVEKTGGSLKWFGPGVSIDQHIVKSLKLAEKTKFPSLQLGVHTNTTVGGDQMNTISWSDAYVGLSAQSDPYQVFNQLFGDIASTGGNADALERLRAEKRSVLDSIRDNAAFLTNKLGAADKRRLDGHLEAVRQIEMGLSDTKNAPGGVCSAPTFGTSQIDWKNNDNAPVVGKLQMDLLAAAFACDLTRVATFMWGAFADGLDHKWLDGCGGGYHGISHDPAIGPGVMTKVGTWYTEQLAYFVDKLKSYEEGDRTVLGNSIVFTTSEYGPNVPDPGSHNSWNMPYLFLGSAGGVFKTERYLRYGDPAHWDQSTFFNNQLFVSFMNAMGVEGDTFGQQSTPGPLPRL